VLALGGGTLLKRENRLLVEGAGPVLCLTAPFDTIIERLQGGSGGRPLLDGDAQESLRRLLDERQAHYASFPLQLDNAGMTIDEALWRAQGLLGRFRISGMGACYDVCIATCGLDNLGQALSARGLKGPLALVSDENVARFHCRRAMEACQVAGYSVHSVTIQPGEHFKTMNTVMRLWGAFLEAGLERGSTVLALGGGVVGDLAGFASAMYLRGVAWATIPTSLLAMVDASLGGKTGADLPQGKNLVGAFHPPRLVLADPAVLETLPEAELRNGLAEALKHGVIGDPRLFELCSHGWEAAQANLDEIVRRAMAVKARIIQEDPYEEGRRAALNLGHTLGHAVEVASGYRLRHGEAVGIGMVAAARQAERMGIAQTGLTSQIAAALAGLGLPTQTPAGLDTGRMRAAIGLDKKRQGGKTRLALPKRIGEVVLYLAEAQEVEALLQI
jgi:shikimate kinase/3-dehydroquinate synthase